MGRFKSMLSYFSRGEMILWCSSVLLIIISFMIFDRVNYMTLMASVIGVTSFIFYSKGNPVGQVLMIVSELNFAKQQRI